VDDWESAFCYDNPRWWLRQSVDLRDPNNFWATRHTEGLVRTADAVTVSSSWLQSRFGGVLLPHARDASAYEPGLDAHAVRERYGLTGRKVIMFLGSPRPHKGLADVIAALDRLADDQVVFVVVGGGPQLPARSWLLALGQRPFGEVPMLLAAADVVVLAQHRNRTTRAQVPAKVFDAMAMGCPIVTTDVGDLAAIVGRHGVVVPPHDVARLAQGIAIALSRSRSEVGAGLRARFEQRYSYQALTPGLASLVHEICAGETAAWGSSRERSIRCT
jgi:glycosyltransferase involved in cell wall biosynthesis